MDEQEKQVTNPVTEEEQQQQEQQQQEEKTFKQEDVDKIVTTRLAKEKEKADKKIKEILTKLGVEDEEKIDDIVVKAKNHDELVQQLEELKSKEQIRNYETELRKLNVDEEFLEFVMTKVDKDENFVDNAKAYLERNPKMLKDNYRRIDSSLGLNGAGLPDLDAMSTEQYLIWRKTHNTDGTVKKN